MSELLAEWGPRAVLFLFSGVAMLLTRYVYGLLKSEYVKRVISRALNEIQAAVMEVAQTYSDAIKKGRDDGKLTEEEKAKARSLAMTIARENIGLKGIRRLVRIFAGDRIDIDKWLGNKVEASVKALKANP